MRDTYMNLVSTYVQLHLLRLISFLMNVNAGAVMFIFCDKYQIITFISKLFCYILCLEIIV